MQDFAVKIQAVQSVIPHPNADRLDLVQIEGWQCVSGKDRFKAGDLVLYIPIDSVLSPEVEAKLFPMGSKVTLSKSRVKTIKLRGAISQGMVVAPAELGLTSWHIGEDFTKTLGIVKYEPPAKDIPAHMNAPGRSPKKQNSAFRKYTDISNFKYYISLFAEGEPVYVTEKMHGTSSRFGWFPTECNTLWKRILRFFGFLKAFEWCLGSRNVQLQDKLRYKGYYDQNVYAKIADHYRLREKLKEGEAVYGEIVGDGIQKGYRYGCADGEHKFYAYDVMKDGRWLDADEFLAFCHARGIPHVPVVHHGPYNHEWMDSLRAGDSTVGGQKVREGIVIKPMKEETCFMGRKVLKYLSDEYLLGDQSDFH